jgi:hypothetical protein
MRLPPIYFFYSYVRGRRMFSRVIIEPDLSRVPSYDSVTRHGRFQSFNCVRCGRAISIDFEKYIGKHADPETVLGNEHGEAVMLHFGILERSLRNGWPKVRIEDCASCDATYLVYIAEFEPRYSWFRGVLQGVTELAPSNSFRASTFAG